MTDRINDESGPARREGRDADASSPMGERAMREAADLPQRDADRADGAGRTMPRGERSGPTISGRSFAGASYGSTQREQTRDHRGESQRHKLDAGGARSDEQRERPADES